MATITSKLNTIDVLAEEVAALKAQSSNSNFTDANHRNRNREKNTYEEDDDVDNPWWLKNPARRHHTKMEFPKFDGGDPRGWILKAEKYFRYYQTPDELKVDIAAMYLEGDALDLFAWINSERTLLYWEELVKALQENYGPAEFQNPDEHLCSIKQVGSVQEYRQEFAKRAARVKNWPEHCLLGVFINGLKEELKSDVRIHKPRSVYKALSLALEYETKAQSSPGPKKASGAPMGRSNNPSNWETRNAYSPGSSYVRATPPLQNTLATPSRLQTSTPSNPSGNGRTWEMERQARREKGLCFRCNEKFAPGHRCKTSSLALMEFAEVEEGTEECDEHESETPMEDLAEISFHAILGKASGTTMKLQGTILNRKVLILVDSGSTHNFISEQVVEELNLSTQSITSFGVQIGNGDVIRCNRICHNVSLQLPGLKITQDYYPFSIGGADVVLGIKWLASLNTVQANWNEMFLIFTLNGKKYKLQGVPHKSSTHASFQFLAKETIPADTKNFSHPTIQDLLHQFNSVFQEPITLPPFRNHFHTIPLLPNSKPPNIRPYRYPHSQKIEIERQVEDLLQIGFIQPSQSPFASPVLLVKKKDGSWRMCVDYRGLNQITVPDKYPIPNVDELLDELHGAAHFSKIDLRFGYHQIRVQPEDIHKTAFRTHSGHYEFIVMPFGLSNAPSTFQSAMNDLFRPYLRKFILVFFDDILVYSKDTQQHQIHLQLTLQLLHNHQFYAKASKCMFGQSQISFLGHVVSVQGVGMEQDKVQSVLSWPIPSNVKELRGFLGLTGYYRRFVKNYGVIARPLTELTKKNGFHWSQAAEDAFIQLKHALTTAPVLQLPDFTKPFTVECDASSNGVGAILLQEGHPIAYFSKGLSFSNRLKSAYDRELLALVLALQKWKHYLLGKHFFVKTDQCSLKFLLEQRLTTSEQQRLLIKLLPFDFSITYKKGAENKGADALSRRF